MLVFEYDGSSFKLDTTTLVASDKIAVIPVTITIPLTRKNLSTLLDTAAVRTGGARLDIDRVIASPDVYADELFTTLVIQKEVLEGDSQGCRSLVPGVVSASEAVRRNMLELKTAAGNDGITVTLKFFVADDASAARIVDGDKLIIGDGLHNGSIYDPLWANYRKPSTTGSVDGGGGCSAGFAALALLAFVPVLRRGKKRR